MKQISEIKRLWYGIVYFWLWNCSIFGGYLIFCPLLPLLIFSPKLYRTLLDCCVTFWQFYVTVLLKVIWGCEVRVSGDTINTKETAILISNHRTRVDWNFLWAAMHLAVQGQNKMAYGTKFVLKDSLRNIPGAGWMMTLAFYVFIKRKWEKDKITIQGYIDYVVDTAYKHLMILFPEGTDFTTKTKESSNKYAELNGLQKYKHVLHPRTTGFIYLVNQMKQKKCLDAVYDVTLIYPDACPQNEEELFFTGKFPKKVLVHLVRYPVDCLPNSKEGLKEFLEKKWQEKEKFIENFKKDGEGIKNFTSPTEPPFWYLFTALFWLLLPCVFFVLLLLSEVYFYIVLGHTALLITLNFMPVGWQNFDMIAFRIKRKIFARNKHE